MRKPSQLFLALQCADRNAVLGKSRSIRPVTGLLWLNVYEQNAIGAYPWLHAQSMSTPFMHSMHCFIYVQSVGRASFMKNLCDR